MNRSRGPRRLLECAVARHINERLELFVLHGRVPPQRMRGARQALIQGAVESKIFFWIFAMRMDRRETRASRNGMSKPLECGKYLGEKINKAGQMERRGAKTGRPARKHCRIRQNKEYFCFNQILFIARRSIAGVCCSRRHGKTANLSGPFHFPTIDFPISPLRKGVHHADRIYARRISRGHLP